MKKSKLFKSTLETDTPAELNEGDLFILSAKVVMDNHFKATETGKISEKAIEKSILKVYQLLKKIAEKIK